MNFRAVNEPRRVGNLKDQAGGGLQEIAFRYYKIKKMRPVSHHGTHNPTQLILNSPAGCFRQMS
jgi:hypothetical protein